MLVNPKVQAAWVKANAVARAKLQAAAGSQAGALAQARLGIAVPTRAGD